MAEALELVINGERHEGFEGGSVVQSMGASLSPTTFTLQYSPRVREDVDPVIIEPGDAVTLKVGDEELFNGYVDKDAMRYDARAATMQVIGRSRLGDVVDCSSILPSRRLRDQTVFEIAQALLADYEVSVLDLAGDATAEPIERFAFERGEKIADTIGRAARLRGVIPLDVAGDLVLTRTGATATETVLERGVNVLTGERRRDWAQRFSSYHFCGQTRANDEVNGLTAAQLLNEVDDRQVTRTRRLVVLAHSGRREDLGRRAILERNVRAGRSETLTYEVAGWRTREGELWRPNIRVPVRDDWFRVDAELLVSRVTLNFSTRPGRFRTRLDLMRPETFLEVEYPTRQRGGMWR